MQPFLPVLTMSATSCPRCPRRGPGQGAWACAALVMVWVSVLLLTLHATAHAAVTALGTTIVGAHPSTNIGSSAQQPQAQRCDAALQSVWTMAYVQEANTAVPQGDAALEAQLQRPLQVIQGHDAYDAELLSAIAFVGKVGDKRAIQPLIEAWRQRTARQLAAIQRVVERLQIQERSERNEA